DEELRAAYRDYDEAVAHSESSLLDEVERPELPGGAMVHRLLAGAEAVLDFRTALTHWSDQGANGNGHRAELATGVLGADQAELLSDLLGTAWPRLRDHAPLAELRTLAASMTDLADLLRDTERRMLAVTEESEQALEVTLALQTDTVRTTAGRILFNEVLPLDLRVWDPKAKNSTNRLVPRKQLAELITETYKRHGQQRCVRLLEDVKRLGFDFATRAGVTIAVTDLPVPSKRPAQWEGGDGQLYFTLQHIREYRPGADLDEASRRGKVVRVVIQEDLELPMARATGNIAVKDSSGRSRQKYARADVVVGPDAVDAELAEHLEPISLKAGDVLSSRVTSGVARYLDELRRTDAKAHRELAKRLSERLWVGGRDELLRWTQAEVDSYNADFDAGLISSGERTSQVTQLWMDASDVVYDLLLAEIRRDNPVYMMSDSGARGGKRQTTQLSGMRGLMSDPSGRLIEDLPIKSNFREGLTLHEYFISTHGARKGLADTALRTADAGYLTRRMVDVGQDVIIREHDCGTANGIRVETVWDAPRRCPTSGLAVRHLGDHCHEASEMLRKLGEQIGVSEVETRLDGEIEYVNAIKPKNSKDAAKYDRLTEGEKVGELEVDREYRFDAVDGWLRLRPLPTEKATSEELPERIAGRVATEPIYHPVTGELLVDADEMITDEMARRLAFGLLFEEVGIRSPATCDARRGICAACYGMDLASKRPVNVGEAVGIIAAQSIGEPGTQLTMRTFHTGGVVAGPQLTGVVNVKRRKMEAMKQLMDDMEAGRFTEDELGSGERERNRAIQEMLKVLEDACGGLLRVVELFEARRPKGEAITTDVDGVVSDVTSRGLRKVIIHSKQPLSAPPDIFKSAVAAETVSSGRRTLIKEGQPITRKVLQTLEEADRDAITIRKEYLVPYRGNLEVRKNDKIDAGDRLTPGPLDPADVLDFKGVKGVVEYIVEEIQKVYRSQGVGINDKHVEIVVRQMLRKREVVHGGDTDLLPGHKVDRAVFEEENERVVSQGGRPATARFCLLGITEASLATESFLSAASFQKTTRVLTEAAVQGKEDRLMGLKENVIIGRLIPAGTGMPVYHETDFSFGDLSREELLGTIAPEREADEEEEHDLAAEMRDLETLRFEGGLGVSLEEPDEPDLDDDYEAEDDEDEVLFADTDSDDDSDGEVHLAEALFDGDEEEDDLAADEDQ
ncbi:MAG: hypothetical protein HUU35_04735, partial [Armatimonadetes bacterium]|nr:hypothetical protein [Armatimonadota bacterium]